MEAVQGDKYDASFWTHNTEVPSASENACTVVVILLKKKNDRTKYDFGRIWIHGDKAQCKAKSSWGWQHGQIRGNGVLTVAVVMGSTPWCTAVWRWCGCCYLTHNLLQALSIQNITIKKRCSYEVRCILYLDWSIFDLACLLFFNF